VVLRPKVRGQVSALRQIFAELATVGSGGVVILLTASPRTFSRSPRSDRHLQALGLYLSGQLGKDLPKRANLAAYLGRNTTRRLACLGDCAINLPCGSVQNRCSRHWAEAMIIHIPFCRSNSPGTVVDWMSGDLAQEWVRSRIAIHGNGLDIFERSHRGLRYLHLDLVTHTGFGVTPIVRSNEATRSGGGNDRRADIIRGCAKLAASTRST